jgi:hypothetical protein
VPDEVGGKSGEERDAGDLFDSADEHLSDDPGKSPKGDANRHSFVPAHIEWQAGYRAESLGPADFDPLARYVHDQRRRDDPSLPAERWQFAQDDQWEPAGFGGAYPPLQLVVAAPAFEAGVPFFS